MKAFAKSTSAIKRSEKLYQRALIEVSQKKYTVMTSDEEISAYLESLTRDEGVSSAHLNN